MANVTLDIAGFYYSIDVEVSDSANVLDVMAAARLRRAPNGGVMDFTADGDGFVTMISVTYDNASTPQSRQISGDLNRVVMRERGTYKFEDNFSVGATISPEGSVPGVLTWQYYIMDGQTLLSGGNLGSRFIRAAGQSNVGPNAVVIPNNGRIIWRLIGIFGANSVIEAGGGRSVKDGLRNARNNEALREILNGG